MSNEFRAPPGFQTGPPEAEQQFILRATKDFAQKIKEGIKEKKLDNFSLTFNGSKVKVEYGQQSLNGKVVELPCVIESHKTFDSKQFYKIADISKMVILEDQNDETNANNQGGAAEKKQEDDKPSLFEHGLTPPLRYVRRRRFRKRAKRIIADVELEVQRLLEEDDKSLEVKISFQDEDDEANENNEESREPRSGAHSAAEISDEDDMETDEKRDEEFGEDDIEMKEELKDNESESNKQDLSKTPIEDDEEDEGEQEDDDEDDDDEEESDTSESEGEAVEIQPSQSSSQASKFKLLEEREIINGQILELQEKIASKEVEISQATNLALKKRFEKNLLDLKSEIEPLKAQLDSIDTQLKQL